MTKYTKQTDKIHQTNGQINTQQAEIGTLIN